MAVLPRGNLSWFKSFSCRVEQQDGLAVVHANAGGHRHADAHGFGRYAFDAAHHARAFGQIHQNHVVGRLRGLGAHDGGGVDRATAAGRRPLEIARAGHRLGDARRKEHAAAAACALQHEAALRQVRKVFLFGSWFGHGGQMDGWMVGCSGGWRGGFGPLVGGRLLGQETARRILMERAFAGHGLGHRFLRVDIAALGLEGVVEHALGDAQRLGGRLVKALCEPQRGCANLAPHYFLTQPHCQRLPRPPPGPSGARTTRALNTRSWARASPMARGSRYMAPMSGTKPRRANAQQNCARGVASTKSAASASERPAPKAAPSAAAITGFSRSTNSSNQRCRLRMRSRPSKMSRWPPWPCTMALTSPPAQKCPPAPVSTTARMPASSRMPAMAAPKAWRIARSSALRASGRCMVSTAVAPTRSICSVSFISSSLLQQSWPPARRGSTACRVCVACVACGAGDGVHRGLADGERTATHPHQAEWGGMGWNGAGWSAQGHDRIDSSATSPDHQSAFTPSERAKGSHLARSSATNLPNACGEPGRGWAPMLRSFSSSSGFLSATLIAWFSSMTAAAGVLAGATRPNQALAWAPAKPASLSVGTSGSCGKRSSSRMASATILPALTCCIDDGSASYMMSTLPPSRLPMADALPVKGTCVTCKPIRRQAYSPARCVMLPLPALPMVSLPGSFVPSAISAARLPAPSVWRATSSSGDLPMPATGTNAFSGS